MAIGIDDATDRDWMVIMEAQKLTAWEHLGPEQQSRAEWAAVADRAVERVNRIKGEEGSPNDAFVARSEDGEMAGYVWVMEESSDAAARRQAVVLDLFVAEAFRGQGLEKRLLRVAEDWGKIRGCVEVGVTLAAHHEEARHLYESQGYSTQSLELGKAL
ncbi:MAG: GNAT family N-acetyltransferase [Anaerolineae bacterium]